ncbi:MAG: YceI family protein [Candidatus Korobacteraceae bacterium]
MRRSRQHNTRFNVGFAIQVTVLVLLGCVLDGVAQTQKVEVTLDPGQTKIDISVHDVHGGVHGSFKLKSGSVTFNPKTGEAYGAIIVDAQSGDTGNSSRDHKMNKDVLESQRYPDIVFTPKRVIGTVDKEGKSNVQVQGVFRIHGADHDLTLTVSVEVSAGRLAATTSFVVPYESLGMKNPSILFLRVDGKAEVSVSAVGKMTFANSGHEAH